MSVDTIKEEMLKTYEETFAEEEMQMNTRFVFPFPFANDFHIKLIELIPAHCHFEVVFEEQMPDDEELHSRFEGIIEGLLYLFDLEGQPAMEDMVVNEESRLVLGTFDRELPCLLLLFARHYEQGLPKQVNINQYTIERFFYTSHPIDAFYEAINEGDHIVEFYNKLAEKYASHEKVKTCGIMVSASDEEYQ
jgi:hypothetical protein